MRSNMVGCKYVSIECQGIWALVLGNGVNLTLATPSAHVRCHSSPHGWQLAKPLNKNKQISTSGTGS